MTANIFVLGMDEPNEAKLPVLPESRADSEPELVAKYDRSSARCPSR